MSVSVWLLAQDATAPVTPRALIEQALLRTNEEKTLPHYTYFLLKHAQNRNSKGKLFFDSTTLYEYTWIGDLPYGRIVESQGKSLRGQALADEHARYEKAVADHAGLDIDVRAKASHLHLVDTGLPLEPLLTAGYTLRELRQETLDGTPTHVIDCTPASLANSPGSAATRHVTLWIAASGVLLREVYDLVADEPGKRRGSHGQSDFQMVDGIRLPRHVTFHLNAPNGNTGDFEDTYTRFRRFSVAVHIVPTTELPADSAPATPPPP